MLKHTILTWLATCFVGTGLLYLFAGLQEGFKDPYMGALILLALGVTLVASIPAMILYGVMADALLRTTPSLKVKALCSGYAVIATLASYFISFGLFSGNFNSMEGGLLLAIIPFALCFALSPWIIPMPPSQIAVVPDSDLFEGPENRNAVPPAYTVIVAIAGCLLLYGLIKLFTNRPALQVGKMGVALIWYVLEVGLRITALALFIRWRSGGWKLLTALAVAGVVGSILSVVSMISLLAGRGGPMIGYLLSLSIFIAGDAVILYLLSRQDLQRRFGVTSREYGICIAVGVAYAIVRMVMYRVMFGVL